MQLTTLYFQQINREGWFNINQNHVNRFYFPQSMFLGPGGEGKGVLPEKLGGGVQPTSQNPYPIYDQNLRYSLPYLSPDQKFKTLFMT